MKQSLLKIHLPKNSKQLFAADFREMLAKAGDGSPLLPPAFFNYGEDGKPLSSVTPEIRIVGGKSWVGVLSMNHESQLFDASVGIASRVASNYYDMPLAINVESKEFSVTRSDFPVVYYLRDMAIKRRTQKAQEKEIEELAKKRIENSLAQIAERYGFNMPKPEQMQIVFHKSKNIGLHLKTRDSKSNEYVSLLNAEISMYLDLRGIWQVGNLPSRGYGRLIKQGGWNSGGGEE